MEIKVLGTSCPNCHDFFDKVKKEAAKIQPGITVEYINDFSQIIALGVMTSPVLLIDGRVALVGSGHSVEKIKEAMGSIGVVNVNSEASVSSGCQYCASIKKVN